MSSDETSTPAIKPTPQTPTSETDSLDKDLQHDIQTMLAQDAKLSDIIQHALCNYDKLARKLERERDEARARFEGHNKPCYYCHQPCNDLAGNPGLWSIPLCHSDEPGKVKWHHIQCVSERLAELVQLRKVCDKQNKTLTNLSIKVHGGSYDWNADPDELTLQEGECFKDYSTLPHVSRKKLDNDKV